MHKYVPQDVDCGEAVCVYDAPIADGEAVSGRILGPTARYCTAISHPLSAHKGALMFLIEVEHGTSIRKIAQSGHATGCGHPSGTAAGNACCPPSGAMRAVSGSLHSHPAAYCRRMLQT